MPNEYIITYICCWFFIDLALYWYTASWVLCIRLSWWCLVESYTDKQKSSLQHICVTIQDQYHNVQILAKTPSSNWFRGLCSSVTFITGDLRLYLQRVYAACPSSEPMKGQRGRKGCFDFFEAPDYEGSHDKTGLVSALLQSLVDTTGWH